MNCQKACKQRAVKFDDCCFLCKAQIIDLYQLCATSLDPNKEFISFEQQALKIVKTIAKQKHAENELSSEKHKFSMLSPYTGCPSMFN